MTRATSDRAGHRDGPDAPESLPGAARSGQEGAPLRVGLVGAGKGGTALLELFLGAPAVQVVAVAEPNPKAPGVTLARAQQIPVVGSHREVFAYRPQVVVEATGRPEVREDLLIARPIEVEIVGARGARLFWDVLMLRAREARQLERAEAIRRMAGGIFHSLRNVFASIHGRSQLLLLWADRHRPAAAELTKGLQIIAQQSARGSEILARVRGFTREPAEEPVRQVAMNDLVREVLVLTEPLIREAQGRATGIEVRQDLGAVAPVVGRASELAEVLMNLVVNAIEAMPGGGTLTLQSMQEGDDVLVRVRDTGPGIAEDVRSRLFTPFFTTKPEGTGLGLSISQEILRRHGGGVTVESVAGHGACFTVRVPAMAGPATAPTAAGKWRALVVDDDAFVRDLLVEALASLGGCVEAAGGGEEALSLLERQPYDVVVLDIVLPDLTGWEVARAARALTPPPGVILLSGWVGADDPALREPLADVFLRKPLRVPDLLQAVQGLLAKRGDASG
jgi:signal transduction histidine kinase/CheY-like chemotaxis protein